MNDKITRQYELCFGILTKTSEGKAYYTIEMWHAYKQELGLNAIRWMRLAVDVDWWKEKFKSLKDFANDHFRGLTKMVINGGVKAYKVLNEAQAEPVCDTILVSYKSKGDNTPFNYGILPLNLRRK